VFRSFAFAAFAAVAVVVAAADSKKAFTVAIVRRDGIIIPFAGYDGTRWRVSWPRPGFDLDIPIGIASVPKRWWGPAGPRSEWQMWPLAPGAGPRTIAVTQPDWIDAHCVRQVVLRTNYRSDEPAPPPAEQPYPKDGLAISPPHAVERIEIVKVADAPASLLTGLRARFNDAEEETADAFSHPIARRVREQAEPTIEALYAFGDAPRAYYVEASRSYPLPEKNDCIVAFGTGWFARNGRKSEWLDMAVDLLRCNKYGATYMLPLGGLRVDGRTFWIVQYAGWDHERYVVVEVKKDRVEAQAYASGGGC